MRSLAFILFGALVQISTAVATPGNLTSQNPSRAARCKAVPGTPEWPTAEEWARLNASVEGRLLQPGAPAAACHAGDQGGAAFNPAKCGTIRAGWANEEWHIAHPTSNMWQNFNNHSCLPDSRAPCSNAGYPVYVVAAKQASDVKAAVDFARTKSVRLNIKNTGHDFLGRSVQPNSLSIWTHNLKGTKWFDKFTPNGCNIAINGPIVTAGSGMQWNELNVAARMRGVGLVSGRLGTVGIAGFLSNGGHGPMSAKYGVGADTVLEIELVAPDGSYIIANECQNQKYFWAMRGGGGSTYGVALTYTLQAIRSGPVGVYVSAVTGVERVASLLSGWPKLAEVGASGYIQGYPQRLGMTSVEVHLPGGSALEIAALMSAPNLRSGLRRDVQNATCSGDVLDSNDATTSVECQLSANAKYLDFKDHATYSAWLSKQEIGKRQRDVASQAASNYAGVGENKLLASWLWSAKDVSDTSKVAAVLRNLDINTELLVDATWGIGTHKPPYLRGYNSVNPTFRNAIMRPAAEMAWSGFDAGKLASRQRDAMKMVKALRSLVPNGGTYANEADAETPDWQHAFWGSNYESLLKIKREVDPEGVFYCRACVGSESFTDNDGVLCRN